MKSNLAVGAKNKMMLTYAVGIALFTGAMTAIAMVVWLVNHMK